MIGFHRIDGGYFMQLRRHGTVTVCPADAATLLRHWRELAERPASGHGGRRLGA